MLAIGVLTAWPSFIGYAATESSAAVCQVPDEALIRHHDNFGGRATLPDAEKIEQYNAQVRAFNVCSQGNVDNNNSEIERIRSEGNTSIRKLADIANTLISDIENKIRQAIEGNAQDDAAARDDAAGFPRPTCRKPDKILLKPVGARGKGRATPVTNSGRYLQMQEGYEVCVRAYMGAATKEITEIAVSANAHIREVADDTNARIAVLHSKSRAVIASTERAAKVEAKIVQGTPLEQFLNREDPILEDGVESVIVEGAKLKRSEDTPTGEGDPDEIICRKPQQLPASRIPGPEICKRNRVWAALKASGLTLSPNGQVMDRYEKVQDSHRNCVRVVVPIGVGAYGGRVENQYCF